MASINLSIGVICRHHIRCADAPVVDEAYHCTGRKEGNILDSYAVAVVLTLSNVVHMPSQSFPALTVTYQYRRVLLLITDP